MNNNNDLLTTYTTLRSQGLSEQSIAAIIGIPRTTMRYKIHKLIKSQPSHTDFPSGPKVLLFDLETAPTLAYVWGRWQQNVSTVQVEHEGGYILSAAWKWLGDDVVHCKVSEDPISGNDYNVCEALSEAIEQADIIIAHNLIKFDYPMLLTRLIKNNLSPLKIIKKIDTLKIAKKHFRFSSNRLDDLGIFLNVGRKQETSGFELWKSVVKGDSQALIDMQTYNIQDVVLLEKVYMKLRAYDNDPSINMGLYYKDNLTRCPCCGSADITTSENSVYTNVSEYQEYVCNSCGSRARGRTVQNSKEKRKVLLIQ